MLNAKKEKLDELLALYGGSASDLNADLMQLDKDRRVITKQPKDEMPQKSQPTDSIITLKNITKRYKSGDNDVYALDGITMSIDKGEFIAITGTSGSGKSTLLQIIGCLDRPTSGDVIIDNKAISKLNDTALSRLRQSTIGFIFQSFYLQPFLRLRDNITVPAMFTNDTKKSINKKVDVLLERVGLSERATHYPKELSGGQIQRSAIARALVNNPHIILADEPTGNLDSTNSKSIIELFRHIRDTLGTTVVVVTHDMDIARQADRIIVLEDGRIV